MSGYIVELYKNIISDEKYWTEQRISNSDLKNKKYITFGEFDKMMVSRTNAFSRMRDVSEMSKDWIGDRQKIFLFELADHNQLEYRESEKECGFFSNDGTAPSLCTKLFLGITIFQLKESQEESLNDIKDTLNICRKNILDIVKRGKEPVECSVFGILGTYGVAVIWAADQYTDILKIINRIKGADILSEDGSERPAYKFISVFTFFAKNKDGHSEEKIAKLEGTALLQITLQTNLSMSMLQEIMGKIPESKNFHTAGEYDLMLETPVRYLYNCFEKGAIFDPASDFYKYHILQTNVKLCESVTGDYLKGIDEEKPEEALKENKEDANHARPYVSEIEPKYRKLREMFFDKFPKTAGMVDSLDLMYGDYHSKIAFVSNKMWAMDYSQQFLAILTLLESSLDAATTMVHGSITTSAFLEDIQEILNCFEYQTIHISESNNLLLNTPKCHLSYTGQNNLVLYAYFGIMKDLIEFAYRMQKESRQSKIIPMISVDTVPEISSFLFMDYGSPFEDRLIKFNFPMMALYALPVYVPYLYHEVFHYVAPRDRVVRNQAKGCILAFCAVKNVIYELLDSEKNGQDCEMALDITEYVLNGRIYRAVVNKYSDPLIDKIKNASEIKCDREMINNKEGVSWIQYEKCLFELLMKYVDEPDKIMLSSNLVYVILDELYCAREGIMKECRTMIDQGVFQEKVMVLLGKFMASLEGIFKNTSQEAKLKAFQRLFKDTGKSGEEFISKDELQQISDALKEAVCDLPMIELARFDVIAYLITYVKIQNDLLKQEDSEAQIQDYIRLGVALDCFFKWDIGNAEKQDKLEALRHVFVQSYVGLYFSEQQSHKANGLNDYIKKIEDKANGWFDKIKGWYREYLKRYHIFSRLLQIVVKQSSIKERLEDTNYKLYEKFECLKIAEYHDSIRLYGTGIIKTVNTPGLADEGKRAEIAKVKERFQKDVFAFNIDIILAYQKQKNFEELGKICERCFDGKELYQYIDEFPKKMSETCVNTVYITGNKAVDAKICKYKVRDLNGLFQMIRKIADALEAQGRKQYGDKGDALWYRGHQDSRYILLPTAMRKYAQCTRAEQSLRDYQIGVYGEFKFRMENASDKIDKTGYTECDYLALMQHHGSPTIYMDWSENAISALYFALEAFIDPAKKDNQNDRDAVLYIMHPNLYNEARNKMMGKVTVKSGRALDRMMENSKLKSTRSLPNLSMQHHSGNLGMFLLGEVRDERDVYEAPFERIESLSLDQDSENVLYLPLAIYASRANARVQAQSGMFMAYNIFTKPSEKKYFDYMALENIQEFYLNVIPDAMPFLYAIVIDGDMKEEVAEWLKTIGVTKDMIYPELANIGERIG